MPNYECNMQSKNYIKSLKLSWKNILQYRTSEGTFKQVHRNQKKSFNLEKHRIGTELSKEYWRLKELKAQAQVQFYILKRCQPIERIGTCYLCLNEKLFIIQSRFKSRLFGLHVFFAFFRK